MILCRFFSFILLKKKRAMATAEEEIRRRLLDVAPEPNESLPFHGRVRLARRKKADAWYIKTAEVNKTIEIYPHSINLII